jgi:hypothetical protein
VPTSDAVLDAFLVVSEELFDTLDGVLTDCGDEYVNAVPEGVPGINSVYALTIHIAGAIGFWGGSFVSGEDIPRDRDAEFRATGTVEQAKAVLARTRAQLPGWALTARTEGIRNRSARGTTRGDLSTVTPEFVLTHILRELAQHVGHAQICRDVVLAAG